MKQINILILVFSLLAGNNGRAGEGSNFIEKSIFWGAITFVATSFVAPLAYVYVNLESIANAESCPYTSGMSYQSREQAFLKMVQDANVDYKKFDHLSKTERNRKLFRKAVIKYHPDRQKDVDPDAFKRFDALYKSL